MRRSTPAAQIPAAFLLAILAPLCALPAAAAPSGSTDPRDATVLIRVASSLRRGRGSGFVVGDGGWVVTAAHVVAADFGDGRMASEGAVMVLSPWTGHWYEGQVRAIDPQADVALVRLEVTGLPALAIADADERDPAALARRWKGVDLQLTGFPADLGSEARAEEVGAAVCPTKLVEMGHRGEGIVCFLQPGKVRPGWSGGPVTRCDSGAVVAVFHSVYRPKQAPEQAYPCASVLFQLTPLLKASGADPSAFACPPAPTLPHAVDAAERVARQIRSLTLATNGDWRRVEAEQQENAKREPDSADAHFLVGLARAAQGDLAAAVAEFREADTRRPNSVLVPLHLGLALEKKGEPAEAEKQLRRALERCPQDTEARLGLARSLSDQNRLSEAERALAEARDRSPNHPAVRYQLGLLMLQQERGADALKELRAAVELVGEREAFLNIHVAYGRALEMQRRNSEAEREYRLVTRLDPDNGEAHFYLANLCLKLDREADARLELALLRRLRTLDSAFASKLKEMEEKLK